METGTGNDLLLQSGAAKHRRTTSSLTGLASAIVAGVFGGRLTTSACGMEAIVSESSQSVTECTVLDNTLDINVFACNLPQSGKV